MRYADKQGFLFYQLAGWFTVYALFTLYTYLRLGEVWYAVGIATCAFFFFAIIIYSYSFCIYPRLYAQNKWLFFIALALLLLLVSLARTYIEFRFISKLFSGKSFFNAGRAHLSYVAVTNLVTLVLAILLKRVSDSFVVMRKQKELERKQLMTEMKLLKAQLQPHFLFNSLNNIYYETYKESPKGGRLIEKLSQIMRFFLEISAKEKIPVELEMQFIKNVIEMEQIRCYHAIRVEITDHADPEILIPPMLMVPLVENALKHGIDKKLSDNYILIEIQTALESISFRIKNRIHTSVANKDSPGTGLKNLKERLALLYNDDYKLQAFAEGDNYTATLIIPRI